MSWPPRRLSSASLRIIVARPCTCGPPARPRPIGRSPASGRRVDHCASTITSNARVLAARAKVSQASRIWPILKRCVIRRPGLILPDRKVFSGIGARTLSTGLVARVMLRSHGAPGGDPPSFHAPRCWRSCRPARRALRHFRPVVVAVDPDDLARLECRGGRTCLGDDTHALPTRNKPYCPYGAAGQARKLPMRSSVQGARSAHRWKDPRICGSDHRAMASPSCALSWLPGRPFGMKPRTPN